MKSDDDEEDSLLRAVAAAPPIAPPLAATREADVPLTAFADDEFRGTTRFTVVRRLGAGGMGVVYEVIDRSINARVALKTMKNATGDAILRFKQEFRALQDLRHRNLVGLGELVRDDRRWFFTMELIAGRSFLDYVRAPSNAEAIAEHDTLPATKPSRCFDEARLREAFAQLMRGLAALHSAQKVHRDVKPSNVLVSADGRVVLLDFGLILDRALDQSSDTNVVGTVAYMAPEQAAGRTAGPAADCYAAGVMLYEALTGQLPFVGRAIEVLVNKQTGRPRSPRSIYSDIPADLEELCLQLLEIDPAQRPTTADVLARLGARKPSVRLETIIEGDSFVGRANELARLENAFSRVVAGSAVTVVVEGESGIGKTALVRHFVEGLGDRAVVLAGRCYERESVPFKALDGVIDALSRYMTRLGDGQAGALLPRNVGVLTQVFPVLSRVEAVQAAPRSGNDALDPQELRTRLFAAVRELFARVADRRPLVIVIDDLQWADADSSAMLTQIMRGPDAPRILVLATCRTNAGGLSELDPEQIALSGLDSADARTLAARLLVVDGKQDNSAATAIATEAAGHPLYIDELVRHARRSGDAAPLQLDEALWSRVLRLDESSRVVLELLAVAGARLPQDTVAQAAGLPPAAFAREVALLRDANLARTGGLRGSDDVECYHDRVRESVLSHLPHDGKQKRHSQLARTLAATGSSNHEALMLHWREAGDADQAARHAAHAAEQAEQALAFNRAARLYQIAIDLRPAADNGPLFEALGRAHANDGLGKDAAEAFLAAAGSDSSLSALDLKRRAAEQLLASGYIQQGMAVIESVLTPLGMRIPRTPRAALWSLVVDRIWLAIRRRKRRSSTPLSAEHLLRIDTCLSAGIGLCLVDNVRGQGFFDRALLLAMEGADDFRFARALAGDSGATGAIGERVRERTLALTNEARRVAESSGDKLAIATATLAEGSGAVLTAAWRHGVDTLRVAEVLLRERCVGAHWEINCARLFLGYGLFKLGRIRELQTDSAQCIREAEQRGNTFGEVLGRSTLNNVGWLCDGEVDEARRQAAIAIDSWSRWTDGSFHNQHLWELTAQGNIATYSGNAGWDEVTKRWRDMERSVVFRVEIARISALDVRARVALSDALLHAKGEARAILLRYARKTANRLRREHSAYARAFGTLVAAQLHAIGGRTDAAISSFADAARRFDAADMPMHAAITRIRQGQLVGGDEGNQLRAAGNAWMMRERIRQPDRWIAMLAPGWTA